MVTLVGEDQAPDASHHHHPFTPSVAIGTGEPLQHDLMGWLDDEGDNCSWLTIADEKQSRNSMHLIAEIK